MSETWARLDWSMGQTLQLLGLALAALWIVCKVIVDCSRCAGYLLRMQQGLGKRHIGWFWIIHFPIFYAVMQIKQVECVLRNPLRTITHRIRLSYHEAAFLESQEFARTMMEIEL